MGRLAPPSDRNRGHMPVGRGIWRMNASRNSAAIRTRLAGRASSLRERSSTRSARLQTAWSAWPSHQAPPTDLQPRLVAVSPLRAKPVPVEWSVAAEHGGEGDPGEEEAGAVKPPAASRGFRVRAGNERVPLANIQEALRIAELRHPC